MNKNELAAKIKDVVLCFCDEITNMDFGKKFIDLPEMEVSIEVEKWHESSNNETVFNVRIINPDEVKAAVTVFEKELKENGVDGLAFTCEKTLICIAVDYGYGDLTLWSDFNQHDYLKDYLKGRKTMVKDLMDREIIMVTKENLEQMYIAGGNIYGVNNPEKGYEALDGISLSDLETRVENNEDDEPLYFIEGSTLESPNTDELILAKTMQERIMDAVRAVEDMDYRKYYTLVFPEANTSFHIYKEYENGKDNYSADMYDMFSGDRVISCWRDLMVETDSLYALADTLEGAVKWRAVERCAVSCKIPENPTYLRNCILHPERLAAGEIIGQVIFDFPEKMASINIRTASDGSGGIKLVNKWETASTVEDITDRMQKAIDSSIGHFAGVYTTVYAEIMDEAYRLFADEVMPSVGADYYEMHNEPEPERE